MKKIVLRKTRELTYVTRRTFTARESKRCAQTIKSPKKKRAALSIVDNDSLDPVKSTNRLNASVLPKDANSAVLLARFLKKKSKALLSPNGLLNIFCFDSLSHSKHFIQRCLERNISPREVYYALAFGSINVAPNNALKSKICNTPSVLSTIGVDLRGLTVVLGVNGKLVTAYRDNSL